MRRLYLTISMGILLALIIASVIASQVLRYSFDQHMRQRLGSRHHGQIRIIQQRLDSVPESELENELVKLQESTLAPLRLVPFESALLPARITTDLQNRDRTHEYKEKGKIDYFIVQNGRYVGIFGPTRPPFPFKWSHLLIVVFIMIPIVGLVGYILTFPVARRLRILDEATKRVGEGNLSARADIHSTDAIGGLAHRFNDMADKIEVLLKNQRHLIQAVSHELRTPIARIRFDLELLESSETKKERSEKATEIKEGLDELNGLVDELFLYMRFDSNNRPLKKEIFDVPMVLDELSEKFDRVRPDVKIKLQSDSDQEMKVEANERYFKRAIQNLISNAVRYAETTVTIHYSKTKDNVLVEVSDDGPGIPSDKRAHLFEPFYRVDDSRNRKSGGAGLGLAIVRRIIKAHGGDVAVADSNVGCKMITNWPAKP